MPTSYTYYCPGGRVEVKSAALRGRGVAWVDGPYHPPTYPSALNVRVGEPGVRISAIVGSLRAYGGDIDAVVRIWSPLLTREDVQAALEFDHRPENSNEIDHKLDEDAAVV